MGPGRAHRPEPVSESLMDRVRRKKRSSTELRARIDRAPVLYLTDFTGLNVKAMTELAQLAAQVGRRVPGREEPPREARLRRVGRAARHQRQPRSDPTGFVFGFEDAATPRRRRSATSPRSTTRSRSSSSGVLDNKILQPEQVEKIAKLPPREQLLRRIGRCLRGTDGRSWLRRSSAKLQEDGRIVRRV